MAGSRVEQGRRAREVIADTASCAKNKAQDQPMHMARMHGYSTTSSVAATILWRSGSQKEPMLMP
eukprot:4710485-Pyramimonas_sp.AAC.1